MHYNCCGTVYNDDVRSSAMQHFGPDITGTRNGDGRSGSSIIQFQS